MSAAREWWCDELDECHDLIRRLLAYALPEMERQAARGYHKHAQRLYDDARSRIDVGYRVALQDRAAGGRSG